MTRISKRGVISVVAALVVALAVAGGAFAAMHRTSHVTRSHHVAKTAHTVKSGSYSANMSTPGCPNMGSSTAPASF